MRGCLDKRLLVTALLPLMAARAQDDLVLRATSQLVQVNVIVHNKSGAPVRDLTREDFVLTDNGRPQAISVFSLDVAEPVTAETPTPHALKIGNRTLRHNTQTPVTVLLFDTLNLGGVGELMYARQELMKFLKTTRGADPLAIYTLNGPQVRVIHDFTDDSSSLVDAVRQLSGLPAVTTGTNISSAMAVSSGTSPSEVAFGSLTKFLKEASRADEANLMRERAEWTLSALEGVAHHLAGVPGRKNLVWISSSFPITIGLSPEAFKAAEQAGVNQEFFGFTDRITKLARLFAEAQVAIYPINPGGLRNETRYQASTSEKNAPDQEQPLITTGVQFEAQFQTMDLVAKETGGLAFYNANDVAGSIRRAVDDARVTYTLGFYPSDAEWDGRYHALKVACTRHGLLLRARSGYLAAASALNARPELDKLLHEAAASPLEGVAIGIEVNVQTRPLHFYGQEMVLRIDTRDIRFENRGGRMTANVDVGFVQQGLDGSTVQGDKKTFEYALLASSYEKALKQGLFYEEWISIDPRTSRLRVVVLDASTGSIGSVSIPVSEKNGNGSQR